MSKSEALQARKETGLPLKLSGPSPVVTQSIAGSGELLSPIFTGLFQDLEARLKDPKGLAEHIRVLYGGLILAASALSFIPTEANFGGALASVLIHDILEPFRRTVYDGTIELELRPLFPTQDMSPRLLVSGVEAGALTVQEVTEELSRAGTRPEAIALAARVAQLKRFTEETKDDFALVRTYNSELIKEAIAALKDEEKAVIADLKNTRAQLVSELVGLQSSGSA